jgi:hypothetical protein
MQSMTLNEMSRAGFTVWPDHYNYAYRLAFTRIELDVLNGALIRRVVYIAGSEYYDQECARLDGQGAKHLLGKFRVGGSTVCRTFRLTRYELGFLVDTLRRHSDMSEIAYGMHALFNQTRTSEG